MTELFPRLAFPDDAHAFTAITESRETISYANLRARALAHAHDVRNQGATGERIAVWANCSVETVVALVGNALLGCASVPLNPKLGHKELAHILSDSMPSLVYGEPPKGIDIVAREVTQQKREGDFSIPVHDSPMLVLYTSGTTGAPKGAILSVQNVASNLSALADCWRWTDDDVVVHSLPLFHVHGLVLGLFGSLRVGGTLRHIKRFSPEAVAKELDDGGTMFFAVPTLHHRLIDAAETTPAIASALKKARLLVSGSAGLPLREHRRMQAITGRGIYERYGLTETLINCGVPAHSPCTPGYVGPALDGIELQLVDDSRTPITLRDDTTLGEVAVRGKNVFLGYLNRPDATAAVLSEDGWFYTGDLATQRQDGSIRIVGRRSVDLIKTGGFKVGAGEVEACLLEDPGVQDVAVVGAPDDDLGQRIVAFVVKKDGADCVERSLIDRVASELTPHKRPREVHFLDALPRNAMGKVTKRALLKDSPS